MKSTIILSASFLLLVSCAPKHRTKYVENPFNNSGNEAKLRDLDLRVSSLEQAVDLNIAAISGYSSSSEDIAVQILALQMELLSLPVPTNGINGTNGIDGQDGQNGSQGATGAQGIQGQAGTDGINGVDTSHADLESRLALLETEQSVHSGQINALQSSVNSLVSQMVQLQMEERVVGLFDPCPNVVYNGYKESLFRLSSGKLVAYFEQGSQRFLSVIGTGNFQTTDGRHCNFMVL